MAQSPLPMEGYPEPQPTLLPLPVPLLPSVPLLPPTTALISFPTSKTFLLSLRALRQTSVGMQN